LSCCLARSCSNSWQLLSFVLHLQKLRALQLELRSNNLESEQLKLEVLRWRKQCSLMRLKLASAREKVQLHESNLDLLSEREQRLSSDAASLRVQLASAVQQLTDMTAAKAQAQAESAKFQVCAACLLLTLHFLCWYTCLHCVAEAD
jgi:chromosome segregation ATPase